MFAPLGNGRHAATVAGGTVARGAVLVQRFILVFSVFLRFSLLLLLFSLFFFFGYFVEGRWCICLSAGPSTLAGDVPITNGGPVERVDG